MADVFLSYARPDLGQVEKLAAALEVAGYSVWWDRHIDGGSEFSADIERELDAARAVVVAWSADGVASRWVRDEAGIALETGKLIAISLDGTPPPIGFKQIHAIDMTSAQAQADLERGLAHKLGRDAPGPPVAEPVADGPSPRRRPLLIGIAVVAVLLAAFGIAQSGQVAGLFEETETEREIAVAVIPFTFSADPDLDEMESSFSASLANNLAATEGVTPASYAATRAAVDRNLSARQLGEELGVSYLVEGEINSAGRILNGNLGLVEAGSGRTIWSRNVSGDMRNISFFEGMIAKTLSSMFLTRIARERGDFEIAEGLDERARDAFLYGYEALNMRGDYGQRPVAQRQFEVAATIEPEFADAHAGLAFIFSDSTSRDLTMTPEELARRQKQASDRALELDPDNLLARLAVANAALLHDGDVATALAKTDELLEEAPRNILVQQVAASARIMAGQPREALALIDQALAADPLNFASFIGRSLALFQIGDYESLKRNLAACPPPCGGAAWLWHAALIRTGTRSAYRSDIDDIIAMAEADPEGVPPDEMDAIARGFLFDERLVIDPEDGYGEGFPYMQVLLRFGHVEDAFRVAMRNVEMQPTIDITWLLDGSRMTVPEELRADPRYHAIFEIPRFKAVAEYRREQGLTDGLPVLPVKPYEGS